MTYKVAFLDVMDAKVQAEIRSELPPDFSIDFAETPDRREHMTMIMRKLSDGAFVVFDALFDVEYGAAGLVVSFLAVLELVKEKLVHVSQNEPFSAIYVKLSDAATDA